MGTLAGLYAAVSIPPIVINGVELVRHARLYSSGNDTISIEPMAPDIVNNLSIAGVGVICLWIYRANQRALALNTIPSQRTPGAAVIVYILAPLIIWKTYSMWTDLRRASLHGRAAAYSREILVLTWCALVLLCTLGAFITYMTVKDIAILGAKITLQGFWIFSFFFAFEVLRISLRIVEIALVAQTNALLNVPTSDPTIA